MRERQVCPPWLLTHPWVPEVKFRAGDVARPTHQMSLSTLYPLAFPTWAVCRAGRSEDCLEDLPSYPLLWAQEIK